MAPFPR